MCKFKNKAPQQNQQAQVADTESQELQIFTASCFHGNHICNTWLIDSDCTHHMSFNAKMFKDLDESFILKVKIGNGELLEVKGKGVVVVKTPTGTKLISDVLFIPKLSQNLLSVEQMMEKGYSLEFKDNACTIYYPHGAELLRVKMKSKSFTLE